MNSSSSSRKRRMTPAGEKKLCLRVMVQWLNSTVGKAHGVPGQITAISAPSGFDRGWFTTISQDYRSSAQLACHATLTLASGAKVSGLFFVDDLGKYDNGVWKGLTVAWISDDAIT